MQILTFYWLKSRLCRFRCGAKLGQSLYSLLFGILIGILIGYYFEFDYFYDHDDFNHVAFRNEDFRKEYANNETFMLSIYLQCIVFVQPDTIKPSNYISAIIEGYSSRCNKTIFFTNSKNLVREFGEKISIYYVDIKLGSINWSLVREAFKFLSTRDKNGTENVPLVNNDVTWTAVLNEQVFLVTQNLRLFLAHQMLLYDMTITPAVIGRRINLKSSLSFMFPSLTMGTFSMESGLIFSNFAIEKLIKDNNDEADNQKSFCNDGFLPMPRYIGKYILKCALSKNFQIWDPIDESGHHLFVPLNIHQIFEKPDTRLLELFQRHGTNKDINKNKIKQADCCSDRAIAFGGFSYREHRLFQFAVNNLRVFGVSRLENYPVLPDIQNIN